MRRKCGALLPEAVPLQVEWAVMSQCPSKTSSSFCMYPWMQISNRSDGTVNLCCSDYGKAKDNGKLLRLGQESMEQIWNSEYHRQARLDFLNGRRRPECSRCYFEEERGIKSMRLAALERHSQEIEEASQAGVFKESLESGFTSAVPFDYDLMLGNKCNLECSMCDTVTSSRMNKSMTSLVDQGLPVEGVLRKHFQLTPQPQSLFDWIDGVEYWNELYTRTPHIRKLCATGGEPTLVPQVAVLFRHILEKGEPEKIDLTTSTNALIYNRELMELMNDPRWKKSNLQVSMDGIGETQEYIRYPSRWEAVWNNFEKICAHKNIHVTVNFVLQAYNIENLLPFLLWMSKHTHLIPPKNVTIRFLKEPSHLQVLVVADSVKNRVRQELEDHMDREELQPWREMLQTVHSYLGEIQDSEQLKKWRAEFIEFTRFLDKHRKKNVDQVLHDVNHLEEKHA